MRKKWISFLGVVCVLCLHAIPSSAEQLTLSELYQMADSQSLVIRVAESELVAANHGVQQAKNALLPSLSADISGSYIGDAYLLSRGFSTSGTTDVILAGLGPQSVDNGLQPTPHWGNNFSFQASQVIYAGGAILAGIEMAKTGERIAQLQVDKSRQEVRLMLTAFYLDLVKLRNQLQVLDTHIALTEEVLTMMRARHEAGTILSSDLTRYELQLKQLQLSRVRLLDAQSIIQHQLQTTLHTNQLLVPDTMYLQQEYGRLVQSVAETYWQQQAASGNLDLQQADAAGGYCWVHLRGVTELEKPVVMSEEEIRERMEEVLGLEEEDEYLLPEEEVMPTKEKKRRERAAWQRWESSTQKLVCNNRDLIAEFRSDEHVRMVIERYRAIAKVPKKKRAVEEKDSWTGKKLDWGM